MLIGIFVSVCIIRYILLFDEFEVDYIVVFVGELINFENFGFFIFIVFEGIGVVV